MNDGIHYKPDLTLADMLGQSALSSDEIAHLRRRAWIEQGILIIPPSDRRLSIPEALLLREIAERIYGGQP